MLRVLISCHQLHSRTGSELYVTELAEAHAERGARVSVFSLFPGELAKRFSTRTGIRVYGPEHSEPLTRLAPDIIHSHHLTTFHLLGELLPGVPRVHGILGVVPDLEQVPITIDEARRVFAVSERTREMMRAAHPNTRVEVVKNWFDDRELRTVKRYTPALDARHRVAVISNHVSDERDQALDQLEAEGLISWERVGVGASPRDITGEFLSGFDIVVTMGRTVPLAGAIGVPCIVADQHLSDGLLSLENLDELSVHNFTGRARRYALTAEHLREEIGKSKLIDRRALAQRIRAEYSLSSRSLLFLRTYETVLNEEATNPLPPRRGEGMVFGDLARRIRRLEARVATLELQAATVEDLSRLEFERDSSERKIQHLQSVKNEILNSTSWKITAPLRRLAELARRLPARLPRSKD